MYARPFIDSLEFARSGMQISAEMPFADFPRLVDLLSNTQGILKYSVQGELDVNGYPVLDITMTGQCQLCCQRCMNALEYPINYHSRLMLCDQAALDALDEEGDDEVDGILSDPNLDVLALLEEEILLSLPIAPKHKLGDCQMAEGSDMQKNIQHPFAVLEKLKRSI